MVDVAQLVEPRIVIPVVVGSSPIIHPIFIMILRGLSLLIPLPQETGEGKVKEGFFMQSTAKLIISCLIGNILEFYDFILYGIFATVIAQHFFQTMDHQVKLMSVFTVLAVGYFARPLGGLFFGHFGDKYSRRKTLIVSLFIMGCVTALIGLLPSYNSIGITATVLLVLLRIVQGLTVSGESSGSMVFLLEHAPKKWRASLSNCVSLGSMLGVLLALFVSYVLTYFYSQQAIINGVWRVPFILGAVLAIIGCYLRFRFWQDTVIHSVKLPVKELFGQQARQIIAAILFLALPAAFTGFSTIYLVPYLMSYLHFSLAQAVQINIWMILIMLVSLFVSAYLSDLLQSYKGWVVVSLVITIIIIYPIFYFIQREGHFIIVGLLLLTAIVSATMGPEIVLLVGFFKKTVRYSGVGFSHGFAFSVIVGTSPLVFNYLTLKFSLIAVAYYLIFAAMVSLVAVMCLPAVCPRDPSPTSGSRE